MRTIHKYVLGGVEQRVSTYERAKFIHVANQREQIVAWAEVNTLERERMATLHVVGTGGEVPRSSTFIGSALMAGGDYVFHVYVADPAPIVTRPTTTDTSPSDGAREDRA